MVQQVVLNLSVIIASLDATSPSRGGLGIRFIFRNDRLSAPKPASAARVRLCASRANRSEAPTPENAMACQGLPYWGAGAERLRGLAASSPLSLQMHWPPYASFSIAASGVRYSLQHSSYMREYSLLGLWCIRLLRVWES